MHVTQKYQQHTFIFITRIRLSTKKSLKKFGAIPGENTNTMTILTIWKYICQRQWK